MSETNLAERKKTVDGELSHEAKRRCEVQVCLKGTIDVGCKPARFEPGKRDLAKLAAFVLMSKYMRGFVRETEPEPIDIDATVLVFDEQGKAMIELSFQEGPGEEPLGFQIEYLDDNGFSLTCDAQAANSESSAAAFAP